ncbi:TolC family protein [Telmatocola sphagniphila]|uniref:TolC family protein n=1 Tax=Telmatocola sphagniphila TaxID=1123043 RepID=A0A8E6EZA9_9BACT|nr:TolC family protein [Telmatocola sphagniphila]QVL33548.1 TolC family protein [Telmatocola sphagniphila]
MLQLAGVDNPTIQIAREIVNEAYANLQASKAQLLPNLTAGVGIDLHYGVLQRSSGLIYDADRQNLYMGNGAYAIGAGTVGIPGVHIVYPVGDMYLEPRARSETFAARSAEAIAVQNNMLLEVSLAFWDLLGYESRIASLIQSQGDLSEIVRITSSYAQARQGRLADAQRAEVNSRLLDKRIRDLKGEAGAASARLAGLINLDPSEPLHLDTQLLIPLTLVDEKAKLEELIPRALANRPEIKVRTNELAETKTRLRQEQVRPWLPTIFAGLSNGAITGGGDRVSYSYSRLDGRVDFDVAAVWTLQNAGMGNRTLMQRNMSVVSQAVSRLNATIDQIRTEVSEAYASAVAAKIRIEQAQLQLKISEEGFRAEYLRIRQAIGLPIEILDSQKQLMDAREELIQATIDYNRAQFQLQVSLGFQPPSSH